MSVSFDESRLPFVPTGHGPPLFVERAEGCELVLRGGGRLLDAAGGAILANIGHGRREVAEAAARALETEGYVVPVFATPSRARLVARLQERWLPPGIGRVYLTSGGSESMDAALRLARQVQVARGEEQRTLLVGRELSYHGTTLATLAVGGHAKRRRGLEPLLPDWPRAPACYCLRCPLGLRHPGCEVACARALEAIVEREGAHRIAAFVAEPIVGSTAGALVPPDEYWPVIAEICRHHGILLVVDEVMTGFGRTGRRFAVEHFGVTPDILVGGKGLAGGYAPMGGVFAREEVVAELGRSGDEFMYYTYGAHPAGCAAADRVLEILEREELVERCARMGKVLANALLAELGDHPHVAEVRGRGLLRAVELVRDRDTLEPFPAEARLTGRVVVEGLQRGVFFYPGGSDPARDVICLGPPFVVTEAQIRTLAGVLREAIDAAVAKAA